MRQTAKTMQDAALLILDGAIASELKKASEYEEDARIALGTARPHESSEYQDGASRHNAIWSVLDAIRREIAAI